MSLILFIEYFVLEDYSESFWKMSSKQDSMMGSSQEAVSAYTGVLLIEFHQNSKQENKLSRASFVSHIAQKWQK